MPRRQARTKTRALQQRATAHRNLAREMLKEGEILIIGGRTVRGEIECYVHYATARLLARLGEAMYCDVFGDPLPLDRPFAGKRCIKQRSSPETH